MSRSMLVLMLTMLVTDPLTASSTSSNPLPEATAFSQPSPAAEDTLLEAALRRLVSSVSGHAAVYARRLGTDQEVSINADEVFPTASMIKIPLLVGLFGAIEEGRFGLMDELPYDETLATPGGGDVLNKLQPGETVTVWRLAGLMIMLGDHVAARWVQQLVGGEHVNEWLAVRGFEHTRVNGRVDGREEAYDSYGWGQSTPKELSRLLGMIRDGEAISESASENMYRLLSRDWWPLGAKSAIPPTVNVAAKAGMVSTARAEIVLVNAPAGDYVLCIMTAAASDGSFEGGDALIRSVSAEVWRRWGHSDSVPVGAN
jgi:beta-lactamase class A